jgi:hypothetical protein
MNGRRAYGDDAAGDGGRRTRHRESSDRGGATAEPEHDTRTVSADRRPGLTSLIRFGPLLAVAGAAGFALAACGGGGGSALSTRTGATATTSAGTQTRSQPTRTRTVALPTTTDATTTETTTTAITTTTTAPGPTTTRPAIIVTTATETQSTTVPVPVTPPSTTSEPVSTTSSSSTPWGWIILGIALAAALVIGLVVYRRSRAGAARWSAQAADLNRRSLLAMDDVLARGSVVTGQIQALASEAQSLEARAPDDRSRAVAAQVRGRLDDLAATLESDRTLRLSSPPPSVEQVSYSSALIRQQVEQLQGVLRPPSAGPRPN